jgi:hypothetical protein
MSQSPFDRNPDSPDSGDNESFIEERKEMLEELFERVEKYIKINIQIYKLRAVEVMAEAASTIMANILIAIIATLFFMLLNVGLAIWIGSLLESSSHGYFILSGFYLLILIILWIFRKNMFKKSVTGGIIKQFEKD